MADLLKVPRTTYANWEGNTVPDIEIIKRISQILGVEFSQLISEKIPEITTTVNEDQPDYKEKYIELLEKVLQEKEKKLKDLEGKNGQAPSGLFGKKNKL